MEDISIYIENVGKKKNEISKRTQVCDLNKYVYKYIKESRSRQANLKVIKVFRLSIDWRTYLNNVDNSIFVHNSCFCYL